MDTMIQQHWNQVSADGQSKDVKYNSQPYAPFH